MDQGKRSAGRAAKMAAGKPKVWQTPKVSAIPVKQMARGGLMPDSDRRGMCNIFTKFCS